MQQAATAGVRPEARLHTIGSRHPVQKDDLTGKGRLALYILICLLLLISAFKFVGEDILLRPQKNRDFRPVYYSTRLWIRGETPYDPNNVLSEVRRTTPALYQQALTLPDIKFALYPPSCFPLMAPLALLPWTAAEDLELAIGLALYLWMIWLLARNMRDMRLKYFWAFALAYAPFHAAFHLGNLSTIATPLSCLSILLVDTNPIAGALLLGISAALKPQLAALFICHLLLSRRWKQFAIASVTGAVLLAAGVGWMALHGVSWLPEYQKNVVQMVSPFANNYNAVTDNGVVNFELFNVQPLAFLVFHDVHRAVEFSYLFFIALFAGYLSFMLLRYQRKPIHRELLLLGFVSSMMFVAVYQRYYAAVALLIVFAWAIYAFPRVLAKCITVAGLIFIPPASKWALLARIVEALAHRSNGSTAQLKGLKQLLLRTGLPRDMHLTGIEILGLALPMLFVFVLLLALSAGMWKDSPLQVEFTTPAEESAA